jgi:hypothetical protein
MFKTLQELLIPLCFSALHNCKLYQKYYFLAVQTVDPIYLYLRTLVLTLSNCLVQVFEYKRLVVDNNRQVRESTHLAMADLASTIGSASFSLSV